MNTYRVTLTNGTQYTLTATAATRADMIREALASAHAAGTDVASITVLSVARAGA